MAECFGASKGLIAISADEAIPPFDVIPGRHSAGSLVFARVMGRWFTWAWDRACAVTVRVSMVGRGQLSCVRFLALPVRLDFGRELVGC